MAKEDIVVPNTSGPKFAVFVWHEFDVHQGRVCFRSRVVPIVAWRYSSEHEGANFDEAQPVFCGQLMPADPVDIPHFGMVMPDNSVWGFDRLYDTVEAFVSDHMPLIPVPMPEGV
jgi:hypothetical protein